MSDEIDRLKAAVLTQAYEIRALQLALVAAIDEATARAPERAALIRSICDALAAPAASFEGSTPEEQANMLQITSRTALLSDLLTAYCLRKDSERGAS